MWKKWLVLAVSLAVLAAGALLISKGLSAGEDKKIMNKGVVI